MCFLISLIPSTILLTLGFFVLYLAAKAEGDLRKFGRFLAIWVFAIALFPPIGGAYMSLTDQCPVSYIVTLGATP